MPFTRARLYNHLTRFISRSQSLPTPIFASSILSPPWKLPSPCDSRFSALRLSLPYSTAPRSPPPSKDSKLPSRLPILHQLRTTYKNTRSSLTPRSSLRSYLTSASTSWQRQRRRSPTQQPPLPQAGPVLPQSSLPPMPLSAPAFLAPSRTSSANTPFPASSPSIISGNLLSAPRLRR